jgi:hypothetical protein
MKRFLFTVPIRFRREPHPFGCSPDDLFTVEAPTETAARLRVNELHGDHIWCSTMDPDDPTTAADISAFYPGEIIDSGIRVEEA